MAVCICVCMCRFGFLRGFSSVFESAEEKKNVRRESAPQPRTGSLRSCNPTHNGKEAHEHVSAKGERAQHTHTHTETRNGDLPMC